MTRKTRFPMMNGQLEKESKFIMNRQGTVKGEIKKKTKRRIPRMNTMENQKKPEDE